MKRILIVLVASVVLVAAGVLLSASSLQVPSGTWIAVGPMNSARSGASTVLLQDGRILITGGNDATGPSPTAELFGANGSFSLAAPMNVPRSGHDSVVMQDGRVLVAGGMTSGGVATNSAEIYDPALSVWTSVTGGMTEARSGATAAVLHDGRVLIAGGQNGTLISSTIEIFDPSIDTFAASGMMSSLRTQHAMTVLTDGRVLIVGGNNGTAPVGSTDIFDPVAGAVSAGPKLSVPRFGHSVTTLLNGQVVVIGGNNGNANAAHMDVTPAELVDFTATTPAFTTLASNLAAPREGHLAFLLPNNNNVLIVGGTSGGATVASAELFTAQGASPNVWTYTFGSTGMMKTARSNATGSANQVNATTSMMQRNGVLVVAGGNDVNGNILNTSEAYGYATVQTDQTEYAPGTTVTITGSGWVPGETVTLSLLESPYFDTHPTLTAVADANGKIVNTQFSPDIHDININFYLTATGSVSQAQTMFSDNTSLKNKGVTVLGAQSTDPVSSGNSTTYGVIASGSVQVDFSGNVGHGDTGCTVSLSASGLPAGASATFAPAILTGTSTQSLFTLLTVSTTAGTTAGTYTFTVTASGTGGAGNECSASDTETSSNVTLVVSATTASTTTSVTSPTVTYGQAATSMVTVSSASASPNGSVSMTVTSGGSAACGTLSAATSTTSTSTCTITYPSAGSYTLTATYTPSGSFAGSSGGGTLTVNKATASVTFGTAPTPTYLGGNFTVTATTNSDGALSFGYVSGPCAVVSATAGTFSSSGAGPCVVSASTAATTNFLAGSASPNQNITIGKAAATVTFGTAPTPTYLGGNFTVTATTNSDGVLSFGYVSGPCAVVSATAGTFSSSGAGPCVVSASTAATTNFLAGSASPNQNITIGKATATVTFGTAPTPTYLGGNFTVTATTNSDGALSFGYVSGPCAVVSATAGTFSSSGAGPCVVSASTAATTNFLAGSASPNQNITIGKAAATVTFGTAPTPTYLGGNFTVTATTNSDGVLSFGYVSGPCAVVSATAGTFSSSGAGPCVVSASTAATTNFLAGSASPNQSITIGKAAATVTFGTAPTPTYLGGNFTVTATTNSDGVLSFGYVSGPCAVVSATAGTFSSSGAGPCVVSASTAATTNFLAGSASPNQNITIGKATATVTFGTAPTPTYLGGNFTVTATTNSDGALSFGYVSGPCAVVSATAGTFSSSGASPCVVSASTAATTNFLAGSASPNQSITIAQATQTITVSGPSSVTYGMTGTATSSGSNGTGAINFSAGTSTGCAVTGVTVSVWNASGSCVLTATIAADSNYKTATSVPFTVMLNPATQTITVSGPGSVTYGMTGTATSSGSNGTGAISFSAGTSTGCAVTGVAVSVWNASGSCVLTATIAADSNYKTATSVPFTVMLNPAMQTITVSGPGSVTYGMTGTATSSGSNGTGAISFSASTSTGCAVTGVTVSVWNASDSCVLTATIAADSNYKTATSVPFAVTLNQAIPTATLAVNNSPVIYSGSVQAATVAISASSVPGAVANILTGGAATQTTAGSYAVTANFVPTDSTDYKTLTGLSAGNFVISQATPTATLAVNNSPVTYNGSGQAATVTISASSVAGAVANILTGGAATQTTAGSYAVTANFVPTDSTDYKTLTGLSAGNFVISQATPTATLAVNNSPVTYNGSGQAATVTISASSVAGAVANIHTGGAATQTSAGTYAVTADFVPTDSTDYKTLTGLSAGNFTINTRATSTMVSFVPSTNTILLGSSATVTATVSDSDAGTKITPTGSVTFSSGVAGDAFSSTTCPLGTNNASDPTAPASCSVTVTPASPTTDVIAVSYPGDGYHSVSTGTSNLLVTTGVTPKQICLTSNFNGTLIPGSSYIWFNSVFKLGSPVSSSSITHLNFHNQSITFNGTTINPPDAQITFDPSATTATTTFNGTVWITTLPTHSTAGNDWLSGLAYPVPSSGLPGGIQPVIWCGTFSTDASSINVAWQWGAAVYTSFGSAMDTLGVKSVDDTKADMYYQNSDHAGTPENYKHFVIGGARGGGGSNWTGSYSGTGGTKQ